ncbi:hypothetical protein HY837_06910 [archaeon]|nr:hypothetical protein [archaeon]
MPRYFTQKITHQELEQKIEAAWKKHPEYKEDEEPCYVSLTKQVEKDLSKVEFDLENLDPWDYKTVDNGLTYLEIVAGGDWEQGVLSIIYWDGSKLRGYIPEEGNLWNTSTKLAYGSDLATYKEDAGESDEENMKKRGIDPENLSLDLNKIIQDITERIQYKEDEVPETQVISANELRQVTPKQIRQIMRRYGETLSDLGSDYDAEFLEWFKQKEPKIYETWLKNEGRYYGKEEDLVYEFIGAFTGDALGSRINNKTHDTLLAEFCSQNPKANKHIYTLLERIE